MAYRYRVMDTFGTHDAICVGHASNKEQSEESARPAWTNCPDRRYWPKITPRVWFNEERPIFHNCTKEQAAKRAGVSPIHIFPSENGMMAVEGWWFS